MRLFIAFPVSQEAEKEMRSVQGQMRVLNPNARVKWVGDEGFHVTIVFLGEITTDFVPQITQILEKICTDHRSFKFELGNLDAFPNAREAKVIVVKVNDEAGVSVKLADELKGSIAEFIPSHMTGLGIVSDDRKFTPHLTLGRNKFGDKIIGFDKIQIKNISWQVDRIELIESELLPGGPRYTVLENFKLKNL